MQAHNDDTTEHGIDRNDDGTHGPEHMSNDEIREWVAEYIDHSEEWTNYGDVNPEMHGGRFVRFEPDDEMYQVIVTWNWADIAPGGNEDASLITVEWYEGQDIYVDGDPSNGFTDVIADILESLGEPEHSIDVCNPDLLSNMQYYVADLPHYITGNRCGGDTTTDYWGALAEYGIEPEDA